MLLSDPSLKSGVVSMYPVLGPYDYQVPEQVGPSAMF